MRSKKGAMTIELSVKDLNNVVETVKLISNKIIEQGYLDEYSNSILKKLLGERWEKEFCIGKFTRSFEKLKCGCCNNENVDEGEKCLNCGEIV